MTNDEARNETTKLRIWVSSFFRLSVPLGGIIRHAPGLAAIFLMSAFNLAATEPDPATKNRLAEVRKMLQQVPLIDGHNDLPWQFRKRGNDLGAIDLNRDNRLLKPPVVTDIPRLRAGGVGGQF